MSTQIGDYGTINKDTGEFEREGNIFQTPELTDLVKGKEEKLNFKSDDVAYETSFSAQKVDVDAAFAARPDIAQAILKVSDFLGPRTPPDNAFDIDSLEICRYHWRDPRRAQAPPGSTMLPR